MAHVSAVRMAMSGRFPSFDALAEEVLAVWRAQDPGAKLPEKRSLSAKIGLLDKGDLTWWRRRDAAVQALCEALEATPEDLGIHKGADDNAFHFDAFPELPPLDLRLERPCELGKATPEHDLHDLHLWMGDGPYAKGHTPTHMLWLHMPPGTGRRLLAARLRTAGDFDVVRTRHLRDASNRLRQERPLVLIVEEADPDGDVVALGQRPTDAGLLVLSPFAWTTTAQAHRWVLAPRTWEWAEATPGERLQMLDDSSWGITRGNWELHADWRSRFANWIERRLDKAGVDTLFTARGLLQWVDAMDPDEQLIRTPADLLPLCRMVHRVAPSKLPDPTSRGGLMRLARELLVHPESSEGLAASWMEHHGVEAFAGLAFDRWRAAEIPWTGGLPAAEWSRMAPATRDTGGLIASDLNALAAADTVSARRQIATNLTDQTTSPALLLQSVGLLARLPNGDLDLRPRWLADLLVRHELAGRVLTTPLEDMAKLWLDRHRRAVLDAVLERLPGTQLMDLVTRCERIADDQSYERTAWEEALFVAVGLRLAREETTDVQAVRWLFDRIRPRLRVRTQGWPPAPWSRPGIEGGDEGIDWLTACWSWSIALRPDFAAEEELRWVFPCADRILPPAPPWMSGLVGNVSKDDKGPFFPTRPPWRRLMDVAARLAAAPLHFLGACPRLLRPGMLLAAATSDRTALGQWWEEIIDNETAEAFIRNRLATSPAPHEAAARLWPSLCAHLAGRAGNKDSFVSSLGPRVHGVVHWVFSHLTPEGFAGLDAEQWQDAAKMVHSLPPHLRVEVLKNMRERDPLPSPADLDDVLRRGGPCLAGELPKWLGQGEHHRVAVAWLWYWAPTEAARIAHEAEVDIGRWLVWACPTAHVALVADIAGRLLSEEHRRAWVHAHLPHAGTTGVDLIQVMWSEGR